MRKLLGLVGRAWSFATAKMEGEHFVMHHGGQVPDFLREAEKLREYGEIGAIIRDITGCFPNMPKETIRFALRKIAQEFKQQHGYEGVTVPRWSKTKPCSWKEPKTKGEIHIGWEVLLDVMEFSLDNAIIEAPEGYGALLRQVPRAASRPCDAFCGRHLHSKRLQGMGQLHQEVVQHEAHGARHCKGAAHRPPTLRVKHLFERRVYARTQIETVVAIVLKLADEDAAFPLVN